MYFQAKEINLIDFWKKNCMHTYLYTALKLVESCWKFGSLESFVYGGKKGLMDKTSAFSFLQKSVTGIVE